MSTPEQRGWKRNWRDANIRQEVLEAGDWGRLVDQKGGYPTFRRAMSVPGLPHCFQRWKNGDKLAYRYLLLQSGDEAGVAEAFGMKHKSPRESGQDLQEITAAAESIRKTFPELQKILARFEYQIRRRWKKKKKDARAALLVKVCPHIPLTHRPDLHHFRTQPRDSNVELRDFLSPHITVEDLEEGGTFLRLLNSRGRNEPSVFALTDLNTVQAGIQSRKLPFIHFVGARIDLTSDVSSGRYGHVEPCILANIPPLLYQQAVDAGDGYWVLKLQARLLGCLTKWCREILHDKIAEIEAESTPSQPEPEPLPAHDADGLRWPGLQRLYLAPQTVTSLHGMLNHAKAAFEEAQEHHVALREDPFYFASTVAEHRDHSVENIPDYLERHHRDVDLPNNGFLNRAVKRMIMQSYRDLFDWELIVLLLEMVMEQEEKLADPNILKEHRTEVFQLLLKLRMAFDFVALPEIVNRALNHLLGHPRDRHLYVRRDPEQLRVEFRDAQPAVLLWMLMQARNNLFTAADRAPEVNVSVEDLLIEVQWVVEKDPESRGGLSSLAEKTIVQAGVLADLRSQLTRFQPTIFSPFRGLGYDIMLTRLGKELCDELSGMRSMVHKLDIVVNSIPNLAAYADPSQGQFAYPASQKRKRSTTLLMQRAELNLDRFWNAFDLAVEERDAEVAAKLSEIMSSSRPVVRTEDWIEPSHDSRPGTAQASSATVDAAAAHLSNLSIGSGPEEGSGKSALLQEASEKKEKVKTRGVADPSKAEEEAAGQQADEDEAATPERSTFKVNSRAMGVVAMLFHQPSAHDQPGDLDWKDFAYTMTAIGFAATQAYGSAWNFAPTGDQLMALSRNSIQIHQPHPAPKFSFVQARRLGRRLTRKYGLDASCFEEKEGNDEEGGEKEPEE